MGLSWRVGLTGNLKNRMTDGYVCRLGEVWLQDLGEGQS